jgi:hypothetical protein
MSDSAVIINNIEDRLNYEMLDTFHRLHSYIVEKFMREYNDYCFSNDDLMILLQEELEIIFNYCYVDDLCDIYTEFSSAGYLQLDIQKYMNFLRIKQFYQEKNGSLQVNNPSLCSNIELHLIHLQKNILECYQQCNRHFNDTQNKDYTDLVSQFTHINIEQVDHLISNSDESYKDTGNDIDNMCDYMNKYCKMDEENSIEMFLQSNLSNIITQFIKKLSKVIVYQ